MKSEKESISFKLDETIIRECSISSNFRLGKELYENKNVEITAYSEG
ncbi:MAG: hypothetical protein HZB41_06580 [Ignavibacteriae bacterium]|nr:hypothetical protein [Ignavibacteriota bacterium]